MITLICQRFQRLGFDFVVEHEPNLVLPFNGTWGFSNMCASDLYFSNRELRPWRAGSTVKDSQYLKAAPRIQLQGEGRSGGRNSQVEGIRARRAHEVGRLKTCPY